MLSGGVRRLIVNADDFGQSESVNRGVIKGCNDGIVTSCSLMVRWPAAEQAGEWAAAHAETSVGLHIDLCEWTAVDGQWRELYRVVDADDEAAVVDELDRQLGRFVRLVGRLPTHLDAHQHVHREGHLQRHVEQLGQRLGIDVRSATPGVTYRGDFYGQYGAGAPYPEGITSASLLAIIASLDQGVTELSCHPADGDLSDLHSMYRDERRVELDALCDSSVRAALEAGGIELTGHTRR